MLRTKQSIVRSNFQEIILAVIIILFAIVVQIRTQGRFMSSENLYDLFRETSILMMVSIGLFMCVLTGGIDLSVSAVMGLSGMLCALTMRDYPFIPVWIILGLSVLVGSICGFITGFLVAKLRIFPLIATLGAQDVYRGLVYVFSKGAWVGQGEMHPDFLSISVNGILGINNLVIVAIVIFFLAFVFLTRTKFGRSIYAVGNSEESAVVSGLNPTKIKWITYIISGTIAGIAGMLWVCKFGNAQGDSASGFELNVIAAVVLGGVNIKGGAGKIQGVMLGALLFGILNNILPLIRISSFWQMGIRGIVIIASIVTNSIVQRKVKNRNVAGGTYGIQ